MIIFVALVTSLEPDVTIRIIPEATRTNYLSTAATKSGTDRGSSVKNLTPVRTDEVQTAHVAVFATACNARPRSNNDQDTEMQKHEDDLGIDIDIDKLNNPGGTLIFVKKT